MAEPDALTTIPALYELYLSSSLWRASLHNVASETSARMNAMENASKNAKEMIQKLDAGDASDIGDEFHVTDVVEFRNALHGANEACKPVVIEELKQAYREGAIPHNWTLAPDVIAEAEAERII